MLLRRISSIDNIENHTFLPYPLTPDSVVVDLGANLGHFSTKIVSRYGLRCVGVEANPTLYQNLRATHDPRLTFLNFAVGGEDAPVTFHVSGDITASSVVDFGVPDAQGTVTVPGRTLATLLRDAGLDQVDLMKVDIEGAEVAMFAAAPDDLLRRIRQITIEFHDQHGSMTHDQFRQIRDRLLGLGFRGIKFSPNNTNWLFFRSDLAGPLRTAYVRYAVRNLRGVLRRLGFRND